MKAEEREDLMRKKKINDDIGLTTADVIKYIAEVAAQQDGISQLAYSIRVISEVAKSLSEQLGQEDRAAQRAFITGLKAVLEASGMTDEQREIQRLAYEANQKAKKSGVITDLSDPYARKEPRKERIRPPGGYPAPK